LRTSNFDPVSVEIFSKQLKRITWIVLVVFGVLILRLWLLQVVHGSTYRGKSEVNRIRLQDIPPVRGMIFDRSGRLLVGNRPSFDLYVTPEEIQNREELLENLSDLVGVERSVAAQKLDDASRRSPFRSVCLKPDISRDELATVETHRFNLPGVMIKVRPMRHYRENSVASHLLGYLGEINEEELKKKQHQENKLGDLIGKSGVEWKWEAFLSGVRGGEQMEVDAAGRKLRVLAKKSPVPGMNVCLSIDGNLQALSEKALKGKKGAIVALNPNDGRILSLASSPPFDPNLFVAGIDRAAWARIVSSGDFPLQNRAISGQYPPGSVFKIIVALAGLEEGVVTLEEGTFCNGVYVLGRESFRCWKERGHGTVNFHRALVESCDVYFYTLGKKLGVDKIAHYAKRFGLGRTTGFEVGQEKSGLIPTSQWKESRFGVSWQEGETVSMSIGQSFVLVTPIQMAALISTVFNGGILYKPQVILWVGKSGEEKVYEFAPKVQGKLEIRQKHLEIVKEALIGVVNEPHGTGWRARMRDVAVAGKTGTAQVITMERGKDSNSEDDVPPEFRDHAWFVAVAPARKPQIALAILVENGGHGGATAAPIAKELIQAYLGMGE